MRRAVSALTAAFVLFGVACGPIAEQEQPTPTVVPARSEEGKQTYEVQRGSIYDTIKGLGRIVSKDEVPLYFKQAGRLKSVNVEVMQPVRKGDLLAELDTGDLKFRIDSARIQMEIAQIELSKQVASAGNVKSDVKSAAASVVAAQAAATRASNELAKLEAGPQPADVAAAQAGVDAARAAVDKAQAQVAALKQPAAHEEAIAARAAVEKARANLEKAQADYDKIAWRPDAKASAQAVALQQATADYQAAVSNLNLKSAGARPEDLSAAEQSLASAEQGLRSAEARLAQVLAGSRPADVRAARLAAERAGVAVADTQAAFAAVAASSGLNTSSYDVAMAQKKVDVARIKYEGLQEEFEMARVRAPFDGIITFVTGKQGERFEAFAPIAIISDPNRLEVSVEFAGSDIARVNPGQEAIVRADAFPNEEIRGKVVRLPGGDAVASGPNSASNQKAVRVSFQPPRAGAMLGQLAEVAVITQAKENIILIPNTAIRRFGPRRYVQVLSPEGRRMDVDVEVGLITETETEITKGLREGQRVIVQ